ncbi:hypothetical protein TNCT_187961 [Trichonephila clavata]|uniref:Uncharacterized protein n=1 Tax=Trichonephila clavata TaxID=2740835 RepID=A0A8X6G1S5_TRICU|nr:hypothetical protein TNCT_187961 [Trichonephila clavata]
MCFISSMLLVLVQRSEVEISTLSTFITRQDSWKPSDPDRELAAGVVSCCGGFESWHHKRPSYVEGLNLAGLKFGEWDATARVMSTTDSLHAA